MVNVGDEGLKAQEQDCKDKSLVLSAVWASDLFFSTAKAFCVKKSLDKAETTLYFLSVRQLLLFSDRCNYMPFCLMAYECCGKILGICTQKCHATIASLCSLWYEITDKICMY